MIVKSKCSVCRSRELLLIYICIGCLGVGAPPPAKKARRGRSTVQQAQIPVPVPPIHLMNQMNQALNGPIVHPNFVM